MVLEHGTATPPFIFNQIAVGNSSSIASKNTASTEAAIHYKPNMSRENQSGRHVDAYSSDSVHAKADRGDEAILTDTYSHYRQDFVPMLEPISET